MGGVRRGEEMDFRVRFFRLNFFHSILPSIRSLGRVGRRSGNHSPTMAFFALFRLELTAVEFLRSFSGYQLGMRFDESPRKLEAVVHICVI